MTGNPLPPGAIAVVTGAAQGIGRAIALRLAADGVRLALWDVLAEGLNETARQCGARGALASAYSVDVGDRAAIGAAARNVIETLGVPFALINNAAIYPRAFVLDLDPAEWERVLSVNLTGPFLCARAFAPAMSARRQGAIVNIASTVGLRGDPRGAHYAASKAGLIALTKSLALALAPSEIRVNCVLPGLSDTVQPLGAMTREELLARGRDIPLGRIGRPEDTANAVAFLLSSESAYITGQSIAVNGGASFVP